MLILFGGSFNPPTNAHLNIANLLLKMFPNAHLVILPVGDTYVKESLVLAEHRYEMLRVMFLNHDRVIVSDYEMKHPFRGTIETLRFFSKIDQDVYYVIGADHLPHLDTWIDFETLLKTYPFIILNRNQINLEKGLKKYEKFWVKPPLLIPFDSNITATKVRNHIHKNKNMLHQDVYTYIVKHHLYQEERETSCIIKDS